ncbi:ArsR/SmtB family transcription factor [Bordetella genomosp. 13]|uniref:ArsR/SmtB family transcription factor n=1 Tax=Bordetella genomosp. 13 TaxID=463040 RepID=UPI00119E49B5|nr:metalloregulator ArsR/SmtB family transcription factor [Bordetella genomosp. 13]
MNSAPPPTPDPILKALAHPVRREMLSWLKDPAQHFADQQHPLELGVCASMFERCGLSQSTVSTHLAILHRAGLVTTRRVGQWVFYQRDEAVIAAFLAQLGRDI